MTTKFDTLLDQLETLRKASDPSDDKAPADKKAAADSPEDDKKIAAAAEDGKKESEKGEEFGKAFTVKLPDGSETEAFDGTAMLKALHQENDLLRSDLAARDTDLLKAFDVMVGVLGQQREVMAEQDKLLKALDARISAVSNAGVGRRTMLAIAEKLTPGTAAGPDAPAPKATASQVLMKAQFMAREGKLDWGALPRIEAHQGRGSIAPDDLLQRYPELLTPVQ